VDIGEKRKEERPLKKQRKVGTHKTRNMKLTSAKVPNLGEVLDTKGASRSRPEQQKYGELEYEDAN